MNFFDTDENSDDELNAAFNATFLKGDSSFLSSGIPPGHRQDIPDEPRELKPVVTYQPPAVDSAEHLYGTARPQKHRKLPGPAGMLPQPGNPVGWVATRLSSLLKKKAVQNEPENPSCLQPRTSSQGEEAELFSRVERDCGSAVWPLVEKYSIVNVLRMVSEGKLPRGKVPVMCGFVDDVELLPTDAKALLKDKTGLIGCTIHRSVIKEYKEQFAGCALLLLKQVSLFSPTGKKFYINITLSNIVRVYTLEKSFCGFSNGALEAIDQNLTHPFCSSDLTSLEAECLRPLSPPPTPLIERRPSVSVSPHGPTIDSETGTKFRPPFKRTHPSGSLAAFVGSATPRGQLRPNVHCNSDSVYRILPPLERPQSVDKTCRRTTLGPGFGSLVLDSTVSPIGNKRVRLLSTADLDASPVENTSVPPKVTTPMGEPVEKLLEDDMDDLLTSLADQSVAGLDI
ncbi:unnamed protein product [Calicophoron daubneyi]|uniref:Homologous recombination OB-fold protein OB-fold domain-containing protein n=1 Tax=Calicophoron daubneyi TaxID=300641 RepID=A0AAV2T746_CALDB